MVFSFAKVLITKISFVGKIGEKCKPVNHNLSHHAAIMISEVQVQESCEAIIHLYEQVLATDVGEYAAKRRRLKLPFIPLPVLASILNEVQQRFTEEPIVMHIQSPFVVVGDIHGHILDLFRILKHFGMPPARRYLFLGDLVDRGEFSTEAVTLVFVMKILWPKDVFIVRGNHEFQDQCERGGFFDELRGIYNDDIVNTYFLKAFAMMPLAAIIDNETLAVHGGIGPALPNLDVIRQVKRPLRNFKNESVADLLWSDPTNTISYFMPSNRGTGNFFGIETVKKFFESNRIKQLVRGHQCIESGCAMEFSGLVVTVFSASNYCNTTSNKSGALVIREDGAYEIICFEPLTYLHRQDVQYNQSDNDQVFKIRSRQSLLAVPKPNTAKIQKPRNLSRFTNNTFSTPQATSKKEPIVVAGSMHSSSARQFNVGGSVIKQPSIKVIAFGP